MSNNNNNNDDNDDHFRSTNIMTQQPTDTEVNQFNISNIKPTKNQTQQKKESYLVPLDTKAPVKQEIKPENFKIQNNTNLDTKDYKPVYNYINYPKGIPYKIDINDLNPYNTLHSDKDIKEVYSSIMGFLNESQVVQSYNISYDNTWQLYGVTTEEYETNSFLITLYCNINENKNIFIEIKRLNGYGFGFNQLFNNLKEKLSLDSLLIKENDNTNTNNNNKDEDEEKEPTWFNSDYTSEEETDIE